MNDEEASGTGKGKGGLPFTSTDESRVTLDKANASYRGMLAVVGMNQGIVSRRISSNGNAFVRHGTSRPTDL